ncbi:ATP-dependent DNA ligase [Aeromicrobium sp. 636]|uniref:DNA ligase (ATP) n=1 Tax=Aeromicrobium senzhongii TaxID=2663859 RepID=A0A8I0ET56_9ACTN|nr:MULTISPECIES: ATP-dependent DNA ligase [Aeromicrobium]MBC9224936.1 ATP-dependent DNA ligase [Aeromicrobium senzhongii]MCQ3997047.1 ATP-dependent DNA ligase [Aeromicrobium sp. 636]
MDLPVMPPVAPMLAKSAKQVPRGDEWLYEPKWDGFRALIFRDGDEIEITSRSTKPLTRYFPDVVEAVRAHTPERCVLDGEIVIAMDGRLSFDALSNRIHPAASRVTMLSRDTPASFVAFDLLALGDRSFLDEPLAVRRAALVDALSAATAPIHVTRVTEDPDEAQRWFTTFEGAGLDGVIAKRLDGPYASNGRTMVKVKHARTADVVVAGYRLHKNSTSERPLLGSMLLGLHADDGRLQHVGVAASFTESRRAELIEELAPLEVAPGESHPWDRWRDDEAQASGRLPGGQSRWTGTKDLSFVPLRPERVVEVAYEHMEGEGDQARFRHTARFQRWRPDREPESCTYAQLEEVARYDLDNVLL